MLPSGMLETERLRLRPYCDDDLDGLAALSADGTVMRYFPAPLDRAGSELLAARIRSHFDDHGFGPWSVEIKGITAYAGFVGLTVPTFAAHFTPCVEIAWRLALRFWGFGYATEAARAALTFGFQSAGYDEIVAMTVPFNRRSRAVMMRLGMRRNAADDFDHPNLPDGHALRRHVLYRLARRDWVSSADKH